MNSYIFVISVEIKKIKGNVFAVNAALLYFGNVLKNCPVDKVKKTELGGHVYDFSVKSVLMLMIFFYFFDIRN